MHEPKYHIAVFGEPNPPEKDTIESGIYHLKSIPFGTDPGDLLLLYCTDNYPGHRMSVPGIGVVLKTEDSKVVYRYLPFNVAVSKYELDEKLEPTDKKKLSNIRFSTHWLFKISRQSFTNIVANREVLWP